MTSMPSASIFSREARVDPGWIPADNQQLSDEITRLAGHINAAQYRFLKLLAALIERQAWGGDSGMKSPAHWLNYTCGIALGAAREKVRVAKCLASLPLMEQAFASGAISYSKVRAMTRTATPDNEETLLMIARHGTAQHVETLVRQTQRARRLCVDSKEESVRNQHQARGFSYYYDDDGMLVFKGKLTAEDGAVFLKAMDAVMQKSGEEENQSPEVELRSTAKQQPESVPAETLLADQPKASFAQKRADALLILSEQALATLSEGLRPLTGGDKYQVMVHLDASRPTDHRQAVCRLEDGRFLTPLAPATARRLACDASLVSVMEDGAGNVLNVGRKTRTIPPAIRRALRLRDRGCRFPGCCETRFVDAHHIQHWCDGGETSLDNLLLLCRQHHRLLHEGVFCIAHLAEGETAGAQETKRNEDLVFRDARGKQLPVALFPQFETSKAAADGSLLIEITNGERGLQIDSRTALTAWRGERMDYDLAVAALL
jgi:hypothetical protein